MIFFWKSPTLYIPDLFHELQMSTIERFDCTFNKNFCKENIFDISNELPSESLLYFNRKILPKNSLARERGLNTCDFGVK